MAALRHSRGPGREAYGQSRVHERGVYERDVSRDTVAEYGDRFIPVIEHYHILEYYSVNAATDCLRSAAHTCVAGSHLR